MALTKIDDRGLNTPIDLLDDEKIRFGTGNDLDIYHSGTNTFFENTTGNVYFRNDGSASYFQMGSGNEDGISIAKDDGVFLYFDGTQKFQTTSYGNASAGQVRVTSSNATTPAFSVGDSGTGFYNTGTNAFGYSANGTQKWNINSSGNLRLFDNVKLELGSGGDVEIYHDGSLSYIRDVGTGGFRIDSNAFEVLNAADTEYIIKTVENGAVELYYDNSKKLHTFSGGVKFFGTLEADDDDKIKLGDSADLEIYHNGSHSYIKDAGTGYLILQGSEIQIQSTTGEDLAKFVPDGAVELYYDNVKHFETNSGGCKVNDSKYVGFGNGNDLTIYHDGSDSVINNNTGNLYINAKTGEAGIKIMPDDSTLLYFNGSERLTTTSSGITVTGSCSGCDFNFSNMNPKNTPANEVDGTRGSWTLQEGVEDLFLINRLSGKKYKFNLTEVS